MRLREIIAVRLADILIVAGYHLRMQEVLEMIYTMFGDRIDTISNSALRLNQAVGEDITSSDLEVVYTHGIAFDPMTMDTDDVGGGGIIPYEDG